MKFIRKGFFYNKDLLLGYYKKIIFSLRDRFFDYRVIIYRRIAYENIIRKVDELFFRLILVDFRKVEVLEIAMKVIKLIGNAVENKFLFINEFVIVRNYFFVIIFYENGSRFGLLENVMIIRFK